MDSITLEYVDGKFVFDSTKDMFSIPNIRRIRTNTGDVKWGFDNIYPAADVTLTHLKSVFTLKGAGDAITNARNVLSVKEKVSDLTLLDEFGDLFIVSPFSHQANAIVKLLYYNRLAVIFEQGLGKTYIALMTHAIRQRILGQRIRMVVVAPKIVASNWKRESDKYTPHFTVVNLFGDKKTRAAQKDVILSTDWDILVTTYDMIGGSKSSHKRLESSKEAKIEYWCVTNSGTRANILLTAMQKKLINDDEYNVLLHPEIPTRPKEEKILWESLSKISPLLNGTDVYAIQNKYEELPFILNQDYNVLVLDEASRVKGHKSSRTLAALDMGDKCSNIYMLSGTLCNGNPQDFFAPFNLLNKNLWGNFTNFERKYITYHSGSKIIKGFKNLDNLKTLVDPYKYQASRNDCIDLPSRQMIRADTGLDTSAINTYNNIIKSEDTFYSIGDYFINISTLGVKINKIHQLLSGFIRPTHTPADVKVCNACPNLLPCCKELIPIAPWSERCKQRHIHGITKKPEMPYITFGCAKLDKLASDLLDTDGKVIIWYMFKFDFTMITSMLDKNKITYITPDVQDCDAIFERDSSIRVFLGQISQGIGITLNSAKTMYYYSHTTNLDHRQQSMDRNYRIGQREKVLLVDYVVSGSIEDFILNLLEHKVDVQTFLHRPVDCYACVHSIDCVKANIQAYSKDCIFSGERINAEKKQTLKLRLYGDT